MSCDRNKIERKYAAAELKGAVAAVRRHDRPHKAGSNSRGASSSATPRSAVYPTRDRNRGCAECAARVFACQGVVRSAV